MEVNGLGSVRGVYTPETRQKADVAKPEAQPESPRDEVEISSAGRLMNELSQATELRAERLAQIKAEIDAGTYDTPEKLESALSRMLNEIRPDSAE